MATTMTNEEIKAKIQQYQRECQQALTESGATFALNRIIVEKKNKIQALRQQCTHINEQGEIDNVLGRCSYCGKKL